MLRILLIVSILLPVLALSQDGEPYLFLTRHPYEAHQTFPGIRKDSVVRDTAYLLEDIILLSPTGHYYSNTSDFSKKNKKSKVAVKQKKYRYTRTGNVLEFETEYYGRIKGSIYADSILRRRIIPSNARIFILVPIKKSKTINDFNGCWRISRGQHVVEFCLNKNDTTAEITTIGHLKEKSWITWANEKAPWYVMEDFGVQTLALGKQGYNELIVQNDSIILWKNHPPVDSYRFETRMLVPYKLEKLTKPYDYIPKEIIKKFLGRWEVALGPCHLYPANKDTLETREEIFSEEVIITKTYIKETNYTRYDDYRWSVGDSGHYIRVKHKEDLPSILSIKSMTQNQIILNNGSCDLLYTRKD